jgi:hypothetical protein
VYGILKSRITKADGDERFCRRKILNYSGKIGIVRYVLKVGIMEADRTGGGGGFVRCSLRYPF